MIEHRLLPPEGAKQNFAPISIDSDDWYAWLNAPTSSSFAFSCEQGVLTARREERHGTWYWYAYRSQAGHLHKVYLGKSEELTLQRLHEAATQLAAGQTTNSQIKGARETTQTSHAPSSEYRMNIPPLHLLTTKISAPPVRPNMVMRPRLMQRLDAVTRNVLTLIVALAGWGKTTLVNGWHAGADHKIYPLSWVSLDAGDNDPLRFWTYVIAALNTQHVGVGETALSLLYATPSPPIQEVLTSLLNALAQLSTEGYCQLSDRKKASFRKKVR